MMNKSIDNFSIFNLMGLVDLTPVEQQSFLLDMQKNIWTEFLFLRLDKILTQAEIAQANKLLDEGGDAQTLSAFIETRVPNFKGLLLDFTRESKISILEKYFTDNINEFTRLKYEGEKLQKYKMALELLKGDKWEELNNLWNPVLKSTILPA